MIKPEQVPDEAMNALLRALQLRKSGREAIAAALNAWPGAEVDDRYYPPRHLIIPIPLTENTNAEA